MIENWAKCPKCKINSDREYELIGRKLKSEYGKVDMNVYLNLVQLASKPQAKLEDTLCERYEIYWVDNEVNVQYSCYCDLCNFDFSFTFNKDVFE